MFERLVDLVIAFIDLFRFWVVIDEFEQGIVLTLGRPREKRFLGLCGGNVLTPGIWLIWPFSIEHVFVDNVVPTTDQLAPQSLTTLDGISIIVSVVITWSIVDVRKITLRVESANKALQDVSYGVVGIMVENTCWDDICKGEFTKKLAKEIRSRSSKWGIKIDDVMLANKTKSRSIRLIGNSPDIRDLN